MRGLKSACLYYDIGEYNSELHMKQSDLLVEIYKLKLDNQLTDMTPAKIKLKFYDSYGFSIR